MIAMSAEVTTPLPPIVLVHGAFHGGWCWSAVVTDLRRRGFEVFTPTQTGLGERRHLLKAATDMGVFVDDILNLIIQEDLSDVVLVGHSYGARTISGVADRMPERIRQLIYLDGGLPIDGLSRLDAMDLTAREARIEAARRHDGGISVPPPPASRFDVHDPVLAEWLERRLTPQPLAVEASAQHLRLPLGANRPVTYVQSVRPKFAGTDAGAERAKQTAGWRFVELEAGHNAMMTHPSEVADLISIEAVLTGRS